MSYFFDDGKVFVRIPLASSTKEKQITFEHYNAYLMQSTLDMIRQNRYSSSDSDYNEHNSLLIQRASIWKMIMPKIQSLPPQTLVEKYVNLRNRVEYTAFVSLIAFLYQNEFRRRGLQIPQN